MAEHLIVEWRRRLVHISVFSRSSPEEYEQTVCGEDFDSGDWYRAPEGTMTTCVFCLGVIEERRDR